MHLTTDVFDLLAESKSLASIPPETQTRLRSLLDRHERQSMGYMHGRDKTRKLVAEKEAQIVALDARVQELEGEVDGLRCVRELEEGSNAQGNATTAATAGGGNESGKAEASGGKGIMPTATTRRWLDGSGWKGSGGSPFNLRRFG